MRPPFEVQGGAYQPDIEQFRNLSAAVMRGELPLGDVIKALDNRNVPPQLRQAPFMITIGAATDPPRRLIPSNRNRMSFLVAFIDSNLRPDALVLLTYGGQPVPGIGIPLGGNSTYGESNGTISIDDIWVAPLHNGANPITYPATVIAYEGSLAVESHLHKQTRNVGRELGRGRGP